MPPSPYRTCTHPGCNTLTQAKTGRCDAHPKPAGWLPDSYRGSAAERGYGFAWTKLRTRILQRDQYRCQACKRAGTLTPAQDVDHIIRKEDGGTDDPRNLQSLCRPCHIAKTAAEKWGKP
jgi:5-methylcytosine-specific restriction protein A